MDDLVQFLRARLDEDATEAAKFDDGDDCEMEPWQVRRDETGAWDSYAYLRIAKARVLAEVDAKRQALDHYERIQQHTRQSDGGDDYIFAEGAVRKQVQYTALPYADHPDYRPEWAPDRP